MNEIRKKWINFNIKNKNDKLEAITDVQDNEGVGALLILLNTIDNRICFSKQ